MGGDSVSDSQRVYTKMAIEAGESFKLLRKTVCGCHQEVAIQLMKRCQQKKETGLLVEGRLLTKEKNLRVLAELGGDRE